MNCWTCAYVQLGGVVFPAACKWFELKGEPAKEIPGMIVDTGCKHHKPKP